MTANETTQVREVIARSYSILAQSLILELYRAIACCRIAKLKRCGLESLPYLMAAEATSAKFKDLQLQGKRIESESILDLMGRLEEELNGTAGFGQDCGPPAAKIAGYAGTFNRA